jgi:hypothetical protein
MTHDSSSESARLTEIFFGHALQRRREVERNDTQFVVYTSANTSKKVIENKELWLRNARLMNDFSEIEHGERCLLNAWHSDLGKKLQTLLATIGPNLPEQIADYLSNTMALRYGSTYLMSFSEHGDATGMEEQFGRLSMWRAYGGETNVAIVFDRTPFFAESNAYGLAFSPVLYRQESAFKENEFREFIESVDANVNFLKEVGVNTVRDYIFTAFHHAVLSLKHPAFSEEREWRLIFTAPKGNESSATKGADNGDEGLKARVVELDEGPQTVFTVPIKSVPEKGLVGADLDQVLKQIIIGPVRFPWTIQEALTETMKVAGISDPVRRVVVSEIPLRR